ncbi:MAG: preprotein translocase subunit SecG [Treponemataceae bacterium]|nr:preprotein translocase subunit SecG [Treponemataceae bacterium]
MSVISIILLVVFVIICVLTVGIVLLQNDESDGMGGLFGGAGSQAFGSRSANVLTKTTYVLVALFFLTSFGLAILNKSPVAANLEIPSAPAQEQNGEWWSEPAEASAETSVQTIEPAAAE